jgi:hypothetical protein
LFDQELWVEHGEERCGPFLPVGGAIPLHRYRKHRKSRQEVRADQVGALDDVVTDEAATLLAAKLKTPLQIGQHLVRAFEAGFEIGAKPIDASVVEAILSRQLNDLEPQLTRNGYDVRSLVERFDAKTSEIRQLLRGDLDPARTRELMDEMRAAGLPT